jgi:hypothetical protein
MAYTIKSKTGSNTTIAVLFPIGRYRRKFILTESVKEFFMEQSS